MSRFLPILPEIFVRGLLLCAAIFIMHLPAFKREIAPEEWWKYKNPTKPNLIDPQYLYPFMIIIPLSVMIIFFLLSGGDYRDIRHGVLANTLGITLNAFLTALMKVMVGRPRPNFFERCYPDGKITSNGECSGNPELVNDGRKSFPSGHASFTFVTMMFIFYYLTAKLNVFNKIGRGESWRLCLCLLPVFTAIGLAIYRTCNYQHHWEDIVVGGIMGSTISYICYRQHFPSIFDPEANQPYSFLG